METIRDAQAAMTTQMVGHVSDAVVRDTTHDVRTIRDAQAAMTTHMVGHVNEVVVRSVTHGVIEDTYGASSLSRGME